MPHPNVADILRGEDAWLDEFETAAVSGTRPEADKELLRNCLRTCLRAFAANYKRQIRHEAALEAEDAWINSPGPINDKLKQVFSRIREGVSYASR